MQTPLGNIENNQLVVREDLSTASLEKQRFVSLSKFPAKLDVNLQGLKKCDSCGVAALIWLLQQANKNQCQISWLHIPEPVANLLRLYQLQDKDLITDAGRAN